MICKKYSAEYKRKKVEEYLEIIKTTKMSKAEFAAQNGISDSTFNDWVLKYQREGTGFCNITNEIIKLSDIEVIDRTPVVVREAETLGIVQAENMVRMSYNGVTIEFNEILLERAMEIIKTW
jgi:transposase-like protein